MLRSTTTRTPLAGGQLGYLLYIIHMAKFGRRGKIYDGKMGHCVCGGYDNDREWININHRWWDQA